MPYRNKMSLLFVLALTLISTTSADNSYPILISNKEGRTIQAIIKELVEDNGQQKVILLIPTRGNTQFTVPLSSLTDESVQRILSQLSSNIPDNTEHVSTEIIEKTFIDVPALKRRLLGNSNKEDTLLNNDEVSPNPDNQIQYRLSASESIESRLLDMSPMHAYSLIVIATRYPKLQFDHRTFQTIHSLLPSLKNTHADISQLLNAIYYTQKYSPSNNKPAAYSGNTSHLRYLTSTNSGDPFIKEDSLTNTTDHTKQAPATSESSIQPLPKPKNAETILSRLKQVTFPEIFKYDGVVILQETFISEKERSAEPTYSLISHANKKSSEVTTISSTLTSKTITIFSKNDRDVKLHPKARRAVSSDNFKTTNFYVTPRNSVRELAFFVLEQDNPQ